MHSAEAEIPTPLPPKSLPSLRVQLREQVGYISKETCLMAGRQAGAMREAALPSRF